MLINREMVNFQKWDFFVIFLCTFTINCVTTGIRNMPTEYMFCFICNISSRKNIDLFSSIFKKIIPSKTTTTFKEVSGVAQPHVICPGIIISHGDETK